MAGLAKGLVDLLVRSDPKRFGAAFKQGGRPPALTGQQYQSAVGSLPGYRHAKGNRLRAYTPTGYKNRKRTGVGYSETFGNEPVATEGPVTSSLDDRRKNRRNTSTMLTANLGYTAPSTLLGG
jgi:hypothetical protein